MTRRSYDQFCGLAAALDLVGERWTLLIVRDLSLGAQRYGDLLAGLPGIGTNLLAERLRTLEEAGVVRRAQLPPPAGVAVYELTDSGRELAAAMLPLAVWGVRRLDLADPSGIRRPDWLFLTLRARFRPDQAVGVDDTYEFRIDGDVFHVHVHDRAIEVERGAAPVAPDVVIATDLPTLIEIGMGRITAPDAAQSGRATVEGTQAALRRCAEILGVGPRARARRPATRSG